MGRMFMCTLCTLDLKNELLIIHVLALLFFLLLFTAVGSITLLLWPLQIRLSTRRSVDSPCPTWVRIRKRVADSRTDSGSETASACGRGRGCGSVVRIRGLMRTQHFGIRTSLMGTDAFLISIPAVIVASRKDTEAERQHIYLCKIVRCM